MTKQNLTAERLRELVSYDQETGTFHWIAGRQGVSAAGARAGSETWNGYWRVCLDREQYQAHRLAWLYTYGEWPGEIDHIDGDRLNNRVENLRVVDRSLNNQNQRRAQRDNKSGFLGVSPNRKGWAASIVVKGKKTHLGTYKTPEEAHAVYLEAKRRMHPACTI